MAGHMNIEKKSSVAMSSVVNEELQLSDSLTLFQCEKCGAILGDSSAIIYICESLGTITIKVPFFDAGLTQFDWKQDASSYCMQYAYYSSLPKVIIQDKLEKYNRAGLNQASTIKKVSCIKCSQNVGMVFQNLPSHLASMEGHISLDVSKVSSNLITVDCSQNENVMAAIMKIQEDISKIQVVMLNINQRLEALENTLAEENDI